MREREFEQLKNDWDARKTANDQPSNKIMKHIKYNIFRFVDSEVNRFMVVARKW